MNLLFGCCANAAVQTAAATGGSAVFQAHSSSAFAYAGLKPEATALKPTIAALRGDLQRLEDVLNFDCLPGFSIPLRMKNELNGIKQLLDEAEQHLDHVPITYCCGAENQARSVQGYKTEIQEWKGKAIVVYSAGGAKEETHEILETYQTMLDRISKRWEQLPSLFLDCVQKANNNNNDDASFLVMKALELPEKMLQRGSDTRLELLRQKALIYEKNGSLESLIHVHSAWKEIVDELSPAVAHQARRREAMTKLDRKWKEIEELNRGALTALPPRWQGAPETSPPPLVVAGTPYLLDNATRFGNDGAQNRPRWWRWHQSRAWFSSVAAREVRASASAPQSKSPS